MRQRLGFGHKNRESMRWGGVIVAEQIIAKNPTLVERESMATRLLRVVPTWQLHVLIPALQERHGEDGQRITELFLFVIADLERQVQSGGLPGDLAIPEMLRAAATSSSETMAAVEELRELLLRHGEPDSPSWSADDPEDPLGGALR